eukprot:Clim_evm103s88 gene=Clim_evmTU103s88
MSPLESQSQKMTPLGDTMEHYRIIKLLGSGSTAHVYSAEEKETKTSVALKIMAKSKSGRRLYASEVYFASRLQHPGLCGLLAHFETSEYLVLVYENADKGDLFMSIEPDVGLKISRAMRYMRQAMLAIEYMHVNNFVHRDIKPENVVLFSDGSAKLIDFGFTTELAQGSECRGLGRGTKAYLAPEAYLKLPNMDEKAVDVWALGVTFFAVLTGSFPWRTPTPSSPEFVKYCRGEFDCGPWNSINPILLTLLRKMLVVRPKARATITEARQFLDEHWYEIFQLEYQRQNRGRDAITRSSFPSAPNHPNEQFEESSTQNEDPKSTSDESQDGMDMEEAEKDYHQRLSVVGLV